MIRTHSLEHGLVTTNGGSSEPHIQSSAETLVSLCRDVIVNKYTLTKLIRWEAMPVHLITHFSGNTISMKFF
jgi:hypothetical protein